MKKFIVDTGKKKYKVEANDAEHAVKLVKTIDVKDRVKDAGWFNLTTIEIQDSSELTLTKLVKDVKKAVRSTVAEITNGRFSNGTLRLQVLVKDSMSNEFNWMELPISYRLSYDVLLKLHTESEYKVKKAQSELNAKLKQFAGKQLYKDKSIVSDSLILIDDAVNCNTFEILAKESGANFHNISSTKKDGVTYMKFVSSAPEAEQERAVNWLRSVLEGQEGSGVLSWGMRGTSRGEMAVMIKDAKISHNDAIKGPLYYIDLDKLLRVFGDKQPQDLNKYDVAHLRRQLSAITSAVRTYEDEIATMKKEIVKAKQVVAKLSKLV